MVPVLLWVARPCFCVQLASFRPRDSNQREARVLVFSFVGGLIAGSSTQIMQACRLFCMSPGCRRIPAGTSLWRWEL